MRFEELKAQKELRQLQEDRKNDKKPPPYKHIKVSTSHHHQLVGARGEASRVISSELLVQDIYRHTEMPLLLAVSCTVEHAFEG